MLGYVIEAAWFLVAICLLVVVHEYGHFIVARLCGVKVLRFSMGFGKRILRWQDSKGCEFAISAIPLGGYVKMLDEREGDVDSSEKHLSFNSKTPAQRIAIAAAGPLANFLLAIFIYWLIFMRGTVVYAPVIGAVDADSLAAQASLEPGQEIVAIDNTPVLSERDVYTALMRRLGETGSIRLEVRYPNSDLTYQSAVNIESWLDDRRDPDPVIGMGFSFVRPRALNRIAQVFPDTPAARAGFVVGDVPAAVNGETIDSWKDFVQWIERSAGVTLVVDVWRDERFVQLQLTPESVKKGRKTVGRAGVGADVEALPDSMRREQHYSLFAALPKAVDETCDTAASVLLSLKKLILREISVKSLSGPIGIAKVAASQANYGFWAFISFLAHLSVVLGVFNLLPVPVLDGGHIVYGLVEWIKGSPVSERIQLLGLQAGMALLLSLMVVAFYNDIFL